MKKYIYVMGVCMMSLLLLSSDPSYGYPEESLNINSNDLLEYIKKENLHNINKICTVDFCDYMRSNNIERAVEIFKKKYQEFVALKSGEEIALSTYLNGFPIVAIECYK